MQHPGYKYAPWVLIAFGLLMWPVSVAVLEFSEGRDSPLPPSAGYIFLFLLLVGFGFCIFAPLITRAALPARFGIMLGSVILLRSHCDDLLATSSAFIAMSKSNQAWSELRKRSESLILCLVRLLRI
jgi:hypothetical protein